MPDQVKKKDDGGPAFAKTVQIMVNGETQDFGNDGMSLRDYFAAAMLPTVEESGTVAAAAKELGIEVNDYDYKIHWPIIAAKRAYAYADAMIAERKKR